MGFPRQEYWNWLPFPSPGDLPDLGIEPMSSACRQFPALQAESVSYLFFLQADSFTTEPPGET